MSEGTLQARVDASAHRARLISRTCGVSASNGGEFARARPIAARPRAPTGTRRRRSIDGSRPDRAAAIGTQPGRRRPATSAATLRRHRRGRARARRTAPTPTPTNRPRRRPPRPSAAPIREPARGMCRGADAPGKLMTRAGRPRCSMRRAICCCCARRRSAVKIASASASASRAQRVHEARRARRSARRTASQSARCSADGGSTGSPVALGEVAVEQPLVAGGGARERITACLRAARAACARRGTGGREPSIRSARSSR